MKNARKTVLCLSSATMNRVLRTTASANLARQFSASVSSPYRHGANRSNAEILVNQVPVIEVDGVLAICDGGSGALGHPVEYIQLNTVSDKPQICKYCGLRFKAKAGSHGHH